MIPLRQNLLPVAMLLLCRAAALAQATADEQTAAEARSRPRPFLDKRVAGDRDTPQALVEGRFGKALNARRSAAIVAGQAGYRTPPLTVECWARVFGSQGFNILVANEPKSSATHWELYSYARSGNFSVYMPGVRPPEIISGVNICDGKWHYLAMTYDGREVVLYVDAREVKRQQVSVVSGERREGGLAFGTLVSRVLGCDGIVDEVRISRLVRVIQGIPGGPFDRDEQTIGLWHFDRLEADGTAFSDDARPGNPARLLSRAPGKAVSEKTTGHWGEDAIGFRWRESDSIDGRWNEMNIGPFLAATIPTPGGPTLKGLCVRVGEQGQAAVCFDTARVTLSAGWSGGLLRFDPARFGLIHLPQIAGQIQFATHGQPAWGEHPVAYDGMYLHGGRVVWSYRVGQHRLLETPWLESSGDTIAFSRSINAQHSTEALTMLVCDLPQGEGKLQTVSGIDLGTVERDGRVTAVAALGQQTRLDINGSRILLTVARHEAPIRYKLLIWRGKPEGLKQFADLAAASAPPPDLAPLTRPGVRQWTQVLETSGQVASDDAPYVVDTIAVPFDNRYKALMFLSGHDFFSNGDAAVCTVHGDVWLVRGIDQRLTNVSWQRFATGLYQPLGLKIVDDTVYVLGKDQITRLHDRDANGEADYYENFNNQGKTSPGTHDYATCLETDSQGDFYYLRAGEGLLRVSRDGARHELVASGWRNPNGMSIGPGDIITVSPQEGEWTPASNIAVVQPGGYYGDDGPRPAPHRPLGYDPPLCWIPRLQDNSSGGQVWVSSDRWGPLSQQLLSFSFGRCWMLLTLRETVKGQMQGGTLTLPLHFESGVMRGRFRPQDGQLYVTGLKGWTTSAVKDGCFQRVRYTGQTSCLPVAVNVRANGIQIRFSEPLLRDSAQDVDNYAVQQWNYRWSEAYGSPEYKVSRPNQEGRDEVEVRSATLLPDETSVFLEIDDLRPVMQMGLSYSLETAGGVPLEQTIYYTIHRVGDTRLQPGPHARDLRPGQLQREQQQHLRPGLILQMRQPLGGELMLDDARTSRMAALLVNEQAAASPFLRPGGFEAELEGWIKVPLKGDYLFRLKGTGAAGLRVNRRDELPERSLRNPLAANVALHKGYNRVRIRYLPPPRGDARLRLYWSSESFTEEVVPPTVFFHDSREPALAAARQRRVGRELFATHNCAKCHTLPGVDLHATVMPELDKDAPSLEHIGTRLQSQWMCRWILDPHALRNHVTMPRLFDAQNPDDRRGAADMAAYLATLVAADRPAAPLDASGSAEGGAILYEDLGCISCHTLTSHDLPDPFQRTSLHYVAAKYRPGALRQFLLQPRRHYAWSRMPDFHLSPAEASDLAAFLRAGAAGKLHSEELLTADPERGRQHIRSAGCGRCHDLGEQHRTPVRRKTLLVATSWDRGCLVQHPTNRRAAPDFAFNQQQRRALRALRSSDWRCLLQWSPQEFSRRTFTALRCDACHHRDQTTSKWPEILFEEGRQGYPPERTPSLTWAGEKLKPSWLEQLFTGGLSYRARPWLKARMPAFRTRGRFLSAGMHAEHGMPAEDRQLPVPDPQLARLGWLLTDKNQGLDCRQCHAMGSTILQMQNQAQGVSFSYVRERLRYEYFQRWMRDPLRIDPASKMPRFAADGLSTKVRHVYGGDAARQFEALWHYLQLLPQPDQDGNQTPR